MDREGFANPERVPSTEGACRCQDAQARGLQDPYPPGAASAPRLRPLSSYQLAMSRTPALLGGKVKDTVIREADTGREECAGGKAGGMQAGAAPGGPGPGDEKNSLSENLAPDDEWGVREEPGKG